MDFAYVVIPVRLSFDRKGTRVMDKGVWSDQCGWAGAITP
jgi:hypothetical protein